MLDLQAGRNGASDPLPLNFATTHSRPLMHPHAYLLLTYLFQATDSIQWDVYLTVAAAFGVSVACESSGVAKGIADLFVDICELQYASAVLPEASKACAASSLLILPLKHSNVYPLYVP